MRNLVKKGVEELIQGTSPLLGIVNVDPDKPSRFVIAAEHPIRRSRIDVQVVGNTTEVDSLQS
jgi:hypothetical protein